MEVPIAVALAQSVPRLPDGPGWWFEPKFDGHRLVMIRDADTVRLQARSGRIVTSQWMDLAVAGMKLRPGTILDGEAVIWRSGRLDFAAVQARAASSVDRARALAEQHPASYAVWDVLAHPVLGDVRARRYTARRELLLDLLADVGPPIQPVPATDDRETALVWYETLQTQGIEGIVAKRGDGTYRRGRHWYKIRHAETVEASVVGYTGAAAQPRALAVRLPDGRTAMSQRLTSVLSTAAAAYLITAGPGPRGHTDDGTPYTSSTTDLTVEVLAGTTRHAVVTVTRLR
ncbi:RNA ligase family protein [Streptomyces sp. NPDC046275]|uniref:ATP-dependent DNA ligase n=1 Tax=Streptomyces sp. NPDC046275 TaxID=3157201 RepID=UPI0033F4613B